MIKKFSIVISILVAAIIIKQTILLRQFNYGAIPSPIIDEFNYVWQARSMQEYGLPMAWTLNSGVYKNSKYSPKIGNLQGFNITDNGKKIDLKQFKQNSKPLSAVKEIDYGYGKEQILFVAPFLDHPPLGGFIYNLGMPKNVKEVEEVKPEDFRKSAIVLAVITSVLLFTFLFLITSNPWIAVLSTIIYSTVPTYILATRMAFLENVVSPLALITFILLFWGVKSFENRKNLKLTYLLIILAGIVGGFGVLAKEPAIGFVVGAAVLLIINRVNRKIIISFLISAALPILIYIGWGFWLQKDLFVGIFLENVGRGYFGAIKMVTQLEALKFKNFPVDGWWIFGFISFLLISIKQKNKKILFLTIPLLTHLLTFLFMGSPNYPWYYLSCIPFLAGCSAVLIWQIYKKPNIGSALAFFLIPFSSSYYWGRTALSLEPSINHYRYIFLMFITLLIFKLKFQKNIIVKFIWFAFLAYLIGRIVIYNEIFFPYLMAHWGNLPVPSLPYF